MTWEHRAVEASALAVVLVLDTFGVPDNVPFGPRDFLIWGIVAWLAMTQPQGNEG